MQIPETEITEAFLRIYFTLKHHGDQVLTQLIQDLQTAKNGKLLWSEDIVELNKQIADIACQERLLAQLKQQAVVDPDIFIFQSNQLAEQRREAKLKKSRILRSEDDQTVQRTQEYVRLTDLNDNQTEQMQTFLDQLAEPSVRERIFTIADALICGQPVAVSSGGGGNSDSDLRWDGRRPDEEEEAYRRRCLMFAVVTVCKQQTKSYRRK